MKKILLILLLFLFSTNMYSAQIYYKYLKYKNNSYQNIYDSKKASDYIYPTKSFYLGIGYGVAFNNQTTFAEEFKTPDKQPLQQIQHQPLFFVGYKLNSFLAFELEYSLSTKSTSSDSYKNENKDNVDLKNTYSQNSLFYLNSVVKYPYFYQHVPYLKLGVGYSNFLNTQKRFIEGTFDPNILNYTYNTKGIHYKVGAGYEYIFDKTSSLQIEYTFTYIPKVNSKETYLHPSFIDLNEVLNMKGGADVSYSKINIAYKFSF